MKHSEILEKVESLVGAPLVLISVDRLNVVTLDDPSAKFGGKQLPNGEYAVVDLRLMLPIK